MCEVKFTGTQFVGVDKLQPDIPELPKPLTIELEHLDNCIARLNQRVIGLELRLDPLLRKVPESGVDPNSLLEADSSDHCKMIHSLTGRVADIFERVDNLIQRVEV